MKEHIFVKFVFKYRLRDVNKYLLERGTDSEVSRKQKQLQVTMLNILSASSLSLAQNKYFI